jgi:ABC-2 type transport system permease protein
MRSYTQLRLLLVRDLHEGFRSPILALLLPIIIPVAMLVLVAGTLSRVTELSGFPTTNYAQWLTPAIVMATPITGMGWAAASLMIDIQNGFVDRLRLLDARPVTLLVSRMMFDVLRVFPAGVAVLAVGLLMGADLNGGVVRTALMFGLLMLWAPAYGGLSFIVTLASRNAQASFAVLPLAIPLQFLSTTYFPSALLPGWVQAASRWNPLTYMVNASRALTTGPLSTGGVVEAFAIALLLTLITQAASLWAFVRAVDGG